MIGTIVQSLARSLPLLYLGRIIFGSGIGVAMHVARLFIPETVPDNLIGELVSYIEAASVVRIVIGYTSGSIFGGEDN